MPQQPPRYSESCRAQLASDSAGTVLHGSLSRAAGEDVGSYAISQGTLAANSNYTIGFAGSALSITPATLTVSANPQSKVYGSADPALTFSVSGFQFSDNAGAVLPSRRSEHLCPDRPASADVPAGSPGNPPRGERPAGPGLSPGEAFMKDDLAGRETARVLVDEFGQKFPEALPLAYHAALPVAINPSG